MKTVAVVALNSSVKEMVMVVVEIGFALFLGRIALMFPVEN